MCGLFGIAGPGIIKQDLEALDDLMHVSALRGTDGTGVAAGSSWSKKEPYMYKIAGDFLYWRMMQKEKDTREIYNIGNTFFIGHTRYRTTGEVDLKSTQPFKLGDITGCHNGTVYINYEGYNSDSEKFLSLIEKEPENIQYAVNHATADDAFALVWYNTQKQTLNFARNKNRKLFFVTNQRRNVIYWASELEMLTLCLRRRGVGEYEAFYFNDGVHYCIQPHKIDSKKNPLFNQIGTFTEKARVVHIGSKSNVKTTTTKTTHTVQNTTSPWEDDQKQSVIIH